VGTEKGKIMTPTRGIEGPDYPWVKLKTRAWITCSISLGVSSNPMRLIDTGKERDDGGNTASNERG